jgi:glycosyltransferase involved in cell wall biosynthesis
VAAFDATSVVSEAEARLLGNANTIVVPNGWTPTDAPLPPATEPVAAFVALMGWRPNEDAATWLCRAIWPRVHARVPDATLLLVGRDPSDALRALAGPGVEITGTVDDVRPYLQRARVGLAPLRSGGGSRLKVLESLDAGRPVVATSKGVEGLDDLVGNGVVVADDAAQLADAISELLSDPARAESLGLVGRRAVAERHSWDAALKPLIDAVAASRVEGT